jgi:enoyl-CoA hydratase
MVKETKHKREKEEGMEYKTIIYETRDNITTITLNRPEKLNAYSFEMSQELIDACMKVNEDPDVRVMVLRGTGRSFCAGHDLDEMYTAPGTPGKTVYPRNMIELINFEKKKYIKSHQALREVKVPTICQVHGYCVVGGFYIANTCDLIVASEDAKFANWAAKFGPIGVEELYEVWYMPIRKVKELLFTGEMVDAREAHRLGIVNRVVPLEKLEEEVQKLAKSIALLNPPTIQMLKQSINNAMDIMGYSNVNAAHFPWHEAGHYGEWHTGTGDQEGVRERYTRLGTRGFIKDLHRDGTAVK